MLASSSDWSIERSPIIDCSSIVKLPCCCPSSLRAAPYDLAIRLSERQPPSSPSPLCTRTMGVVVLKSWISSQVPTTGQNEVQDGTLYVALIMLSQRSFDQFAGSYASTASPPSAALYLTSFTHNEYSCFSGRSRTESAHDSSCIVRLPFRSLQML